MDVVSAYRSASHQFAAWQTNFPRYYHQTADQRAALEGGEHGEQAAAHLAHYIGRRLGAPGYSLHNDGRAIDFGTTEAGRALTADTSAASVAAWKRTWLFAWLEQNAARWDFFQNTSIDEPWHWEHRGSPGARAGQHAREAVALSAGRIEVAGVPLLARHCGTPPDLVLKWNDLADPAQPIDVVVHLHGYSSQGAGMRLPDDKEPFSGLDFHDPEQPSGPPGRTRPTLGVLPRGNFFGGRTGAGYDFPALVTEAGLQELIELALTRLQTVLGESVHQGRLLLTAHSGGGVTLMRMLRHTDPDEVHVFDGLYSQPDPLIAWARDHIRRDAALAAGELGSALRVLYRPGTATEAHSLAVHWAVCEALVAGEGRPLVDRYRVEETTTSHRRIPRRYGWRLLASVSGMS